MLSLATLIFGALDDNGFPLIDPDANTWCKFPQKQIKPGMDPSVWWETMPMSTSDAGEQGGKQPVREQGGEQPAANYWDKTKLMKWLQEHPITATGNVAFLQHEVASRKKTAVDAMRENKKESQQLAEIDHAEKKHKSWGRRYPYL